MASTQPASHVLMTKRAVAPARRHPAQENESGRGPGSRFRLRSSSYGGPARACLSGTTVEALRGLIPLQEGARAVDGTRLQLRRIPPREHRDLGIRAERGD